MRRDDYKHNQNNFTQRTQQPSNKPRGNYRIDEYGNPIVPNQVSSGEPTLSDQDYFDSMQSEETNQNRLEQRNYSSDYYNNQQILQERKAQPTRRSNQYTATHRMNRTNQNSDNSPSESRTRTGNFYQGQNNQPYSETYSHHSSNQRKDWYHRLLNRPKKKDAPALPKGRIKLFSVYGIIYIIMIWAGIQILPFDKVNQVVVTGNDLATSQEVESSARILPYDSTNQVLNQAEEIEAKIIEENPLVKQIQFDTKDWRYLELRVDENRFVGKMPSGETTLYLLSSGETVTVANPQSIPNQNIQQLPSMHDFHDNNKLIETAEALGQIEPELVGQMSNVYLSTNPNKPNTIEIQMTDGNVVKGLINTIAQKIQYYPQMLSQLGDQSGVINLEVGAYFTPNQIGTNSIKLDTNLDNQQ